MNANLSPILSPQLPVLNIAGYQCNSEQHDCLQKEGLGTPSRLWDLVCFVWLVPKIIIGPVLLVFWPLRPI